MKQCLIVILCTCALLGIQDLTFALDHASAAATIQTSPSDPVVSSAPLSAPKEESLGATVWYYIKGIAILGFFAFAVVYIAITLMKKPKFVPVTLDQMKAKRRSQGKPESSVIDNEAAQIDVGQAFNTWQIVSKPGEEEFRSPLSMSQITTSHGCLDSAIRSLPTDPDIINNINDLGEILNNQIKRRFTGSMKLIYCALAVCVLAYLTSKGFGQFFKHYWWLPASIVLYYFASYSPEFLNTKRERWFRGFNIHNVLIGTILGLFASTSVTDTYKTTYSDGSTKKTEEWNVMFFIMTALTLIVIVVLGFFIFLFAGLNFVRNYLIYV